MRDLIVIRNEGGFCSQMQFHALEFFYREKGFRVKWDLSWFHDKHVEGRDFVLDKAFPSFAFELADGDEIAMAKRHTVSNGLDSVRSPAYLYKTYAWRRDIFIRHRREFHNAFKPIDSGDLIDLERRICEGQSCAVHVRRGDLSDYNSDFGMPTSADWFVRAIMLVSGFDENMTFYFFSDGLDWVKREILPKLPSRIKWVLCDRNDQNKNYLDLYLMTRCTHVIGSHGSNGVCAKILKETGLFLTPRYDPRMIKNFSDVVFIPDTAAIESAPKIGVDFTGIDRFLYKIWKHLGKKLGLKK